MALQLTAQLAHEAEQLIAQRRRVVARAIHPLGMPSPRWSAQLLVLVVLAISGCKKRLPVPEGDVLASLAIRTVSDTTFDPAPLRNAPTLVLFATPTCPHCIAELPIAQRAATAEKANLVAVFVAGGAKQAASVTQHAGFTAPALIDDGTLRKQYNVKSVPYLLVLGKDGRAREAFRGKQEEDTLREALSDAR